MGSFKGSEIERYGGQGGAGYFSLKNDHDVARVRFMYSGVDDIEGYAVHQAEINGRKRNISCLRSYDEPVDKCPFCKAKMFQSAKLFIPLYDVDSGDVKIWERGKKFYAKLSSLCARYPNLCGHEFEIERNGKPGSTSTTYEIYETQNDDTTLDDLPEVPDIMGGVVLEKTAEEMEYYLEHGEFPANQTSTVVRRGNAPATDDGRRVVRRTPANNNRERF